MSKNRLKLLIALLLLCAALGAAGLALRGAAALVVYFQDGADPGAALNMVPNVPLDLHVAVAWGADAPDIGQAPGPDDRAAIEAAYLRAWLQWNLSYVRGEPYGLRSSFVGPALAQVTRAVAAASAEGGRVEQVNLAHRPRLQLYAAGGSLALLRDEGARVAQLVYAADGSLAFAGESLAAYDVLLVRDEGLWKVRNLTRREGALLGSPAPAAPAPGRPQAQGDALLVAGAPWRAAGVNYYPQATPWDRFWDEYSPAQTATDFALIRRMGMNSVRVFVPFEPFGGPAVRPQLLDRLESLLDHAHAADLLVVVTLFDFYTSYDPLLWPRSDRHLAAVLGRLAGHPALLAWDLKNEPDRDYEAAGRDRVEAWLAHSARVARELAPGDLITIGWSTPAAARALPDYVDLVSFHFYAPADGLPAAIADLRGLGRPLLLGEFGLPTWNSFLFPNGHTELEQAVYYADVLRVSRRADGSGSMAWTLYDFTEVPAQVAGRWPWQTGPQRQLGVLRADGSPKPAAALLDPAAPLPEQTLPLWARILKPFWLSALLTLLSLAGLAAFGRRRRRRA